MSTFDDYTIHPDTGRIELATWIDDYFGSHHYGVKFPDGQIFDPYEFTCERVGPKSKAIIDELVTALGHAMVWAPLPTDFPIVTEYTGLVDKYGVKP